MNKQTYIALFTIVALLIIGFCGFLLGRKFQHAPVDPVIKYMPGDTIENTIYIDRPYKVIPPIDTLDIINQAIRDGIYIVPHNIDTMYIPTKVDTMALLVDYATKRIYNETLFDVDTLGTCKIQFNIQYNQLDSLSYTYVPIIKEVTITQYVTPKFQPFVSAGLSYPYGAYVGFGGVIKSHWGMEASIGTTINKDVQARIGAIYMF